jgi:hypothetical protein
LNIFDDFNHVVALKLKGNSVCGRLAIISVIVIIIVVLCCFNLIDTEEQITLTSGDIYPPPMPIHARHKLRLCAPKFHLTLTS